MKDKIEFMYGEYGKYINQYRAFPMTLDGLKIVERRLLYALYLLARKDFTKSAKVIGFTIGNMHPHGDMSAYGSLVGMVQNGIAEGQGNWGIDVGISDNPAAAQRYTEVRSSKKILDLCFEYIDYVDFAALELDEEPVYLATKLPVCLISKNGTEGIGFGYKTNIPSYKIEDLVKRLKWLLTNEGQEPIIRPSIDCDLLDDDSVFKQLLTTGNAKLSLKGRCELNVKDNSVIIRSTPPGKSCSKILEAFQKEIEIDKSVAWTDESTTSTKLRIRIIKPRSIDIQKLLEKLLNTLKGSVTYDCYMTGVDGKCIRLSIDEMLLTCYNNYKNIIEKYLNKNIQNCVDKIIELEIINKIKTLLPELLKAHSNDPDAIMLILHQTLSVELKVIKELFDKYTISRLLKVKSEVTEVESKKAQFENDLNNITNFVWTTKYEGLS